MSVSIESVQQALKSVKDPNTQIDFVSAKSARNIKVNDGDVSMDIVLGYPAKSQIDLIRKLVVTAIRELPGVKNVSVAITTDIVAHSVQRGVKLLPGVKNIIAVASGKGGVGKSTTAVNLALALAAEGAQVGILDADIYGPSLPQMLGTRERPRSEGQRIMPLSRWGLKAMSIGFLVEEETPMIWRGPMVMGALEQMMGQVAWGPLDVMIVDMPPGTGDAQLTMSQRVPLAGAVIVSTPQDVALLDARRGVRMFEKVNVPVLGLIENMSFFCCPNCNHRSDIFSHGGAKREAERLGVEFLGELPLKLEIRELADAGTPIVMARPDSEEAQSYRRIARRVWEKAAAKADAAPKIVME